MTLREQVHDALWDADLPMGNLSRGQAVDAVLVVFAECERLLRERIEALRGEWVHDGSAQAVLGAVLNVLGEYAA